MKLRKAPFSRMLLGLPAACLNWGQESRGTILDTVTGNSGAASLGLNVRGQQIRYWPAEETRRLRDSPAPLRHSVNLLRLQLPVDNSSLEVFIRGDVTLSGIRVAATREPSISVFPEGAKVQDLSLEANELTDFEGAPVQISPEIHKGTTGLQSGGRIA
jgi:hypothetical protein